MTTEQKLLLSLLAAALNRSPCYCPWNNVKQIKCGRCEALEAFQTYALKERAHETQS